MHPPLLPTINASLNALAGILVVCGIVAIKQSKKEIHRKLMIAAFVCSTVFLCSYVYERLTTHLLTRYPGTGFLKTLYFLVLIPHTLLAVTIVPFIIMAIRHALRGEYDKHKRITRWLYPVWLYVSTTGVIVYLMLYILPTG